jgi:hypothetical protein
MNKEFIPYERALELKELGFNEPCMFPYHRNNTNYIDDAHIELANYNATEKLVSAVLYQQAFRWFRKKYKLSGTPHYFTGGFYCYTINDMKDTEESNRLFTEFESFEEAELACLKKLIEIVKNK